MSVLPMRAVDVRHARCVLDALPSAVADGV
jgi:hypothetical protein